MIEYAIERDSNGKPCRLIWLPPVSRPKCACGTPMTHEPECDECNAQIDTQLLRRIEADVPADKFTAIFGGEKVVVYGEGYGAGIQKGGCYRPDKAFIVFDVLVAGTWWLNWANTCDVAAKLGLDTVPYHGFMTLEEATKRVRVGVKSCFGDFTAEGLVGRPLETLFDKKGARLIVKLKTKDF